ncbi:MAG TPA: 50S ribosomal protein L18 [Candidatus Woesearchaeota archaeon]|nr:50S ribosomal protein L18 [Candidatus Woesearchaeota archaeon]
MKKSTRMIPFRRKREGKTSYDRRIKLLKSGQIRLLISYGSRNIRAQAIKFNLKGDEVLADANAKSLNAFGWSFTSSNLPTSYLFGYYFGKLLLEKNLPEVIFDTGMITPKKGGKYYAFAKGVVDSSVSMEVDPAVFPTEDRISGKHITNHVKQLKQKGLYDKRYSYHLKEKIDTEKITELFNNVLEKIKQTNKLSNTKSTAKPSAKPSAKSSAKSDVKSVVTTIKTDSKSAKSNALGEKGKND